MGFMPFLKLEVEKKERKKCRCIRKAVQRQKTAAAQRLVFHSCPHIITMTMQLPTFYIHRWNYRDSFISHKVAIESYDLTVVNYYSCLFNSSAGAKSPCETQLRANKIPATLSQPFVQVMPQILFKPGALCQSTRWQCKDKRQGHFGVT